MSAEEQDQRYTEKRSKQSYVLKKRYERKGVWYTERKKGAYFRAKNSDTKKKRNNFSTENASSSVMTHYRMYEKTGYELSHPPGSTTEDPTE